MKDQDVIQKVTSEFNEQVEKREPPECLHDALGEINDAGSLLNHFIDRHPRNKEVIASAATYVAAQAMRLMRDCT